MEGVRERQERTKGRGGGEAGERVGRESERDGRGRDREQGGERKIEKGRKEGEDKGERERCMVLWLQESDE